MMKRCVTAMLTGILMLVGPHIFPETEDRIDRSLDQKPPAQGHSVQKDDQPIYTPEQSFLFETIHNRRTVRKFKSTPVPGTHIQKILNAARMAPTAGNQQPWKFLVVQDREKLDRLHTRAHRWYLDNIRKTRSLAPEKLEKIRRRLTPLLADVLSAPVYVAVLVDSEARYGDYAVYDGTLAAGTLMIAARALGYGTGFFTSFFPEQEMKEFFNIPERYTLICFTPVGIPETWPAPPPKKDLEDVVEYESFR